MELQDALRGRRAVRDFKSDPVPAQLLRRLAEAGVQAPSSMNEQPWRFSIINDPVLLLRMSTLAKKHLTNCLGVLPKQEHFRPVFTDPSFHLFHHAPALVVISADSVNPWVTEDCSLAGANIMLAAQDMGLGTCWVGFAQAWLNSLEGRRILDIPVSHHVVGPIAVGYPRAVPPAVLRRPPDIVWIRDDPSFAADLQSSRANPH